MTMRFKNGTSLLRGLCLAVALMVAPALLTGCEVITDFVAGSPLKLLEEAREKGGELADKTAQRAADVLDTYCEKTPKEVREAVREAVNSKSATGDIQVTCVGDEQATMKFNVDDNGDVRYALLEHDGSGGVRAHGGLMRLRSDGAGTGRADPPLDGDPAPGG